jgi:nitrite reductase (NADH) small subunit
VTRHLVGRVEELPPGSRKLLPVGKYGVGVFNVGGSFHALRNVCPHAGAPLCRGRVGGTTIATTPYEPAFVREGEILRCPWHGWEFEIESGETITQPTRRVQTYPVIIEDGLVFVDA